jgi:hypothetical protein
MDSGVGKRRSSAKVSRTTVISHAYLRSASRRYPISPVCKTSFNFIICSPKLPRRTFLLRQVTFLSHIMASQAKYSEDTVEQVKTAGWNSDKSVQQYARAERVTRPFARYLVKQSGVATDVGTNDVHVLDLATGTGAVITETYDEVPKERWPDLKITGADVSPHMLEFLKKKGEVEGWKGLETRIEDGNVGHRDLILWADCADGGNRTYNWARKCTRTPSSRSASSS